jgi:hypothetical protein
MVSPYLTQVLAEAHTDELLRAVCRTRGARRRPAPSRLPRLRAWWVGQLRRPGVARVAIVPGRPVTPCGCVGR